jgi:CheY-like chemotaxis protein
VPTADGAFLFSLHSLVREVHDVIAPFAKSRGLIFSWYIAPALPALLEGDAPRLRGALSLLLQNAVQATRRGAVQLSIRRNPGSPDPGDLLCVISDNGSAQRTDAGFFHAWELAARTGGAFTVDYSPNGGTQISFTVRFALPSEEEAREHLGEGPEAAEAELDDDEPMPVLDDIREPLTFAVASAKAPFAAAPANGDEDLSGALPPPADELAVVPRIVASEMTTSNRRLLSACLSSLPHEHITASSNSHVLDILRDHPVSLIIFDADTPESDIVRIIAAIRKEEAGRRPSTPILVLTSHSRQSTRMLKAGANHALCKPYSRESLRAAVTSVLPHLGAYLEPAGAAPAEPADKDFPDDIALAGLGPDNIAAGYLASLMPPPNTREQAVEREVDLPPRRGPMSAAPSLPPLQPLTPKMTDLAGATMPAGGAPVVEPLDAADERGQDLLDMALRDATQAQGEPVEVALPPRHVFGGSDILLVDERMEKLSGLQAPFGHGPSVRPSSPEENEPPAAPMLLGLAFEDVAPAGAVTRPGQSSENGPSGPDASQAGIDEAGIGSLLDFMLSDAEGTHVAEAGREKTTPEPASAVQEAPAAQPAPLASSTVCRVKVKPRRIKSAPKQPSAQPSARLGGNETGRQTATGTHVSLGAQPLREAPPMRKAAPEQSPAAPAAPPPAVAAPAEDEAACRAALPLPGIEGESLNPVSLPLAPGLIHALRDSMRDAVSAGREGNSILVQEAAARMADKAEHFELHKLGKVARYVERAAEAGDMEAMEALLGDLQSVTGRYVNALDECFQNFLSLDR